jgi:membrane fusion protein (multidrug efflux system)
MYVLCAIARTTDFPGFAMTDKSADRHVSLDIADRRGAWVRALTLAASFIATVAILAACSPGEQAQGPGGGGMPPALVSVQTVKPVSVPVRFEFVGQTAGSKEAEVRARVQGILERRTYQEGSRVKAGQLLFVIDPKPYAAQLQAAEADLARAEAQSAQARRNLDRVKPLAGSKALSQREYDEAVSAAESGAAAVKQTQARLTEARLNLGYTSVTAPVTGLASRALRSEGSLVAPGQDSLLTTISQVDPLYVNFGVSEAEQRQMLKAIGSGDAIAANPKDVNAATIALRLSDGTPYPQKGRLAFIDPRINPQTGSFEARAEVPNPDGALRPGQFVRVVLESAPRPDVIVVPQRAVMDGPQGKFVYTTGKSQDGKDVALPKPVSVGDWVDIDGQPQWIIEKGLAPGDVVIVDGTAKIFPIPGGAPIMLGPPPGMDGKGGPPGAGKGGPGKDAGPTQKK